MRLVKKTVNFDNHHVYHFYYGTERGAPGTIWTTFPYKDRGVRVGVERRRAGGDHLVLRAVPPRFPSGGTGCTRSGAEVATPRRRLARRHWSQPIRRGSGSNSSARDRDAREPWTGNGVGAAEAVRGLHGVTMTVRALGPTLDLMTRRARLHNRQQEAMRTRLAVGRRRAGALHRCRRRPERRAGRQRPWHRASCGDGHCHRRRAAAVAGRAAAAGVQRHRGARPLLLPVDLLSASPAASCSKWRRSSRGSPWTSRCHRSGESSSCRPGRNHTARASSRASLRVEYR